MAHFERLLHQAGQNDPEELGILLANEAISEDQHRAGCQFAWPHWRVFGRSCHL